MIPLNCILWKKEKLTKEDVSLQTNFDTLQTYTDESHLVRFLLKCKECGQLYFYEFYEEIDWKKGDDPQYRTYIPVENEKEANKLAEMSSLEILKNNPRLQYDWPAGEEKTIRWIGKETGVINMNTNKEFQKRFKKMTDQELLETFNNDIGNPGWVSARALFLSALRDEFNNRGIDLSETENKGKAIKNKMKLVGKKVVIES